MQDLKSVAPRRRPTPRWPIYKRQHPGKRAASPPHHGSQLVPARAKRGKGRERRAGRLRLRQGAGPFRAANKVFRPRAVSKEFY